MLKKFLLIVAGIFFATTSAFAVNIPQPVGYVNDFASVLSTTERTALEEQLRAFEKQTSNEVAIATITSFEGADAFTFRKELFDSWQLGQAGRGNGILFLVAIEDREAYIVVGKGLEGALPDGLAGTILRQEVFPSFKEGKIGEGIQNGATSIIEATKGEYTPQKVSSSSASSRIPLDFLLPLGFLFITYIGSFLARSKSWWMGGVLGAGSGGILNFLLTSNGLLGALILALPLGLAGLLIDYKLSKNYQIRKEKGLPTDFWHSGGGFWFGGGGRGGFGGGGFGGFGGGGSWGGGGAGGKW